MVKTSANLITDPVDLRRFVQKIELELITMTHQERGSVQSYMHFHWLFCKYTKKELALLTYEIEFLVE